MSDRIKKIFENESFQKESEDLINAIECNLFIVAKKNTITIAAYLLYKAKLKSDKVISYDELFNGEYDIPDELIVPIKDTIKETQWEKIANLISEYSKESMLIAAFNNDKLFTVGNKPASEFTPESLVNLAKKILDVKDNEAVADLCSGYGTFLNAISIENESANLTGYDIDSEASAVAAIRNNAIEDTANIYTRDVFSIMDDENHKTFDKLFSNYPLGFRQRNLHSGESYLEKIKAENKEVKRISSADWMFNFLLCDLMKENGKAVAIMTTGSTWNTEDKLVRKHFIENGLIEAVITLPERMFIGTAVSMTMIVFSHNNDGVRIVDASSICHKGRRYNEFDESDLGKILDALLKDSEISKKVDVKQLSENDYALNLSRYLSYDVHFDDGIPFKDVIKSISRGSSINAKQLDELAATTVTDIQYVSLSNIKDGVLSEELPYLEQLDAKYDKYCLEDKDLIISKNGSPCKIAVAEVEEGQKLLATGNLFIVRLDLEKVNPYYLKAFFESETGKMLIKSITVGTVILNIGIAPLQNLVIPVPSMEIQKKIADKYQAKLDEIKVLKLKLEKAENKLQHIYDEERRSM